MLFNGRSFTALSADKPAAAPTVAAPSKTGSPAAIPIPMAINYPTISAQVQKKYIIATGSSTGGTEALLALLRALPVNSPGIICVQHMPPTFTKMYAERLNTELPFTVHEAVNGQRILPANVYIAPGGLQMAITKRGADYYLKLDDTIGKDSGHCPSVNFLFRSVAVNVGKYAIGAILTGMGEDGAEGMLKMRQAGAFNIGQDKASSVVYGMPRKAWENGAVEVQADLAAMGSMIGRYLIKKSQNI